MTEQAPSLDPWFPAWTRVLADAHAGGASQMFLLHGNVGDLVRTEGREPAAYVMLPEFLAGQVFGAWDVVLHYDQVRGPRALAGSPARLARMNAVVERFIGPAEELRGLRDPAKALAVLDRFLELALLREGDRPSVAIVLDYAHSLVPSTDVSYTTRELASNLATLLNWARSPYFKRASFAFCLISERASDLSSLLVRNPHTTKIEVPHPDESEREKYLRWAAGGRPMEELAEVDAGRLARLTAGLTLVQLQGLVQGAVRGGRKVTLDALKAFKKQMIEGQCEGLVEFVEPRHRLDMVAGHEAAKRRLTQDAELLKAGRLDAVPMGYLICGPVGTGKTFLAECYAGQVGVPCLKLRNFRSKYVGETEGNLEKILRLLRVVGPVAVIIDEADAMLGDREADGDSGTSSRVFGQFAAQMGDTAYRGKILWFLLTCRPDLLPIDLKRQGRCEVHIPLLPPHTDDEFRRMFVNMGRKNQVAIRPEDVPPLPPDARLSGADIEGVVTRARRAALLAGEADVSPQRLADALAGFLPSADSDEKALQTLAAVLECTEIEFLPEEFRGELAKPGGRAAIAKKLRVLVASV